MTGRCDRCGRFVKAGGCTAHPPVVVAPERPSLRPTVYVPRRRSWRERVTDWVAERWDQLVTAVEGRSWIAGLVIFVVITVLMIVWNVVDRTGEL